MSLLLKRLYLKFENSGRLKCSCGALFTTVPDPVCPRCGKRDSITDACEHELGTFDGKDWKCRRCGSKAMFTDVEEDRRVPAGMECPYCGESDMDNLLPGAPDGEGPENEILCQTCGKQYHLKA
jgi:uncharacterized Zn-finger protein